MDREIINRIFNDYERMRSVASIKRQERLDEVYNKLPRIKEIDETLNKIGFETTFKIISSPDKSSVHRASMENAMLELIDERDALLTKNGYSINYTDIQYNCPYCEDTGYVGNERCACYKQKLINALYEESDLSHLLYKQNFDTFNLNVYSKDYIDPDEGISSYERMSDIYNICKDFCNRFDQYDKSLLFVGGAGLGKTFLSCAVAKELIDKGKTVLHVRCSKLVNMYEDYRFSRGDYISAKQKIDKLYNADLLIIDDLGTETQYKLSASLLLDLFESRLEQGKKMIITTNLTMNEIGQIYSARILSRLSQYFLTLWFIGEDIRMK